MTAPQKLTPPQVRALRFYAAPHGQPRMRLGGLPRYDVRQRLTDAGLIAPHPDRTTFDHVLTDEGRRVLAALDATLPPDGAR